MNVPPVRNNSMLSSSVSRSHNIMEDGKQETNVVEISIQSEIQRSIFSVCEKRHARSMSTLLGDHKLENDDVAAQTNLLRVSAMEDERMIEIRRINSELMKQKTALPPVPSTTVRRSIFTVKEKNSAAERARYVW
jgi:hypothetical protein